MFSISVTWHNLPEYIAKVYKIVAVAYPIEKIPAVSIPFILVTIIKKNSEFRT